MQKVTPHSVFLNPVRPGRTLRPACARGLLLVGVVLVGGCVQYHVDRLGDPDLSVDRVNDIYALEKYPDNLAAQSAIIKALYDANWPVQSFAASALRKFEITDAKMKLAACRGLVQLLDNENSGKVCIRSSNRYTLYGLPPLKETAHKTLTQLTNEDFGYDKDRWREYLSSQR